MNIQFYQEDGHVYAMNGYINEPVKMEVGNDGYPLADTTDFDNYVDYKPPEKPEVTPKAAKKVTLSLSGPVAYYKKHGDDVKGHFSTWFIKKVLLKEKQESRLVSHAELHTNGWKRTEMKFPDMQNLQIAYELKK